MPNVPILLLGVMRSQHFLFLYTRIIEIVSSLTLSIWGEYVKYSRKITVLLKIHSYVNFGRMREKKKPAFLSGEEEKGAELKVTLVKLLTTNFLHSVKRLRDFCTSSVIVFPCI